MQRNYLEVDFTAPRGAKAHLGLMDESGSTIPRWIIWKHLLPKGFHALKMAVGIGDNCCARAHLLNSVSDYGHRGFVCNGSDPAKPSLRNARLLFPKGAIRSVPPGRARTRHIQTCV